MDYNFTIPVEIIQETKTYKDLISRKETIKASFLEKRQVRQLITNAFLVNQNTGNIPEGIGHTNKNVVLDLVKSNYKI